MIPILYENTETSFLSDGIARLIDCISCTVTEERNGVYECEFSYPVTGAHFDEITAERIVGVTHDEEGDIQPFDIYKISEPIDGVVTFYAHHISYRLNEIVVKPFTAANCAAALAGIVSNSVGGNPFTLDTNKDVTADYIVDAPKAARPLLGGEQNSILDVYGSGDYDFDRFSVYLYTRRGQDTDVAIKYGVNLIDYTDETDWSNCYNAAVPYWAGEVFDDTTGASESVMMLLPELYIDSGFSLPGGRRVAVPMDLSGDFETKPTEAELREAATSKLADSYGWIPNQNINVDFVQLWQTEEYKQYAPLQRVKLCDSVLVDFPMYGVTGLRIKVVKVIWNVLLDRYDEMELGSPQTTLAGTISQSMDVSEQIAKFSEELDKTTVITDNTNQHFWFTGSGTDTGAHITEVDRIAFLLDPTHGGGNLLARSNGIAVRDGLTELATFSAGGSRIGRLASIYTLVDSNGQSLYNAGVLVGRLHQEQNYQPEYSETVFANALFLEAAQYFALKINTSQSDHPVMETDGDITAFSFGDCYMYLDDAYSDGGAVVASLQNPNYNRNSFKTCFQVLTEDIEVWMGVGSGGENHGVYSGNAGEWLIYMNNNNHIVIPKAESVTTSDGANLHITNAGVLKKHTSSSERYKKNIEDIQNAEDLYDVKVRQFKYKDDYLMDDDRRYEKTLPGFIVEELEDVYPVAVDYNDDELPEDWNARYMIPPMLKLIQDQKKEIEELKKRIEALEGR